MRDEDKDAPCQCVYPDKCACKNGVEESEPIFETSYTVRVLSRGAIPQGVSLEQVLEESDTGEYIATERRNSSYQVRHEAVKRILINEYSNDGHFFEEEGV